MEIIQAELPSDANVYFIGDFHEGAKAQSASSLEQAIEMIRTDPIGWAVVMGDLAECIPVTDKRFALSTIEENKTSIFQQYISITDKLRPIKKKILYVHTGNHDLKLERREVGDLVKDYACKELGVPYGGYTAVLDILHKKKGGGKQFMVYTSHGWGVLKSAADDLIRAHSNKLLTLKRRLKHKFGSASAMIMGNAHQLIVSPPKGGLYLVVEGGMIKQRYTIERHEGLYVDPNHRWYGCSGCFLRTTLPSVTTYSELMGFDPVEIGMLKMVVRDSHIQDIERVVL
ncbi:hypothetical protein LCGC14_1500470 [marine sediment metagenome]|uniref:Calcineurin-like phosphoesterase domain-containing protein n=1 Tax=marine sediment metagenome TaxID=412755 RepID=A0A0F9M5P3_9ZZZZ